MRTCFFIGHRDAPESIYPQILAAAEGCISPDADTEFIVGQYGHFDSMAVQAVVELKKQHSRIRLIRLDPYLPAKPLTCGFDGALFPPGQEFVPGRAAIVQANMYAAETCDILIAYAIYPGSNSRKLVDHIQPRIGRDGLKLVLLNRT